MALATGLQQGTSPLPPTTLLQPGAIRMPLPSTPSALKSARRAEDRAFEPRQACPRCARPPAVCVCSALPPAPLETATRILVLQHPNERKRKTISTVPLLPLTLANVEVKVSYHFDAATLAPLRDAVAAGRRPLLLFPGPGAVLLDDPAALFRAPGGSTASAPGLLAAHEPVLLVLIDGTWSEARAVARASPSVLAACAQVAFAGDTADALYGGVRREPSAECVSTLEAACRCLRLLEPGSAAVHAATAHLEASMRSLVRQQLGCVPSGAPRSSGLSPKQRHAALTEKRRAAVEAAAADRGEV